MSNYPYPGLQTLFLNQCGALVETFELPTILPPMIMAAIEDQLLPYLAKARARDHISTRSALLPLPEVPIRLPQPIPKGLFTGLPCDIYTHALASGYKIRLPQKRMAAYLEHTFYYWLYQPFAPIGELMITVPTPAQISAHTNRPRPVIYTLTPPEHLATRSIREIFEWCNMPLHYNPIEKYQGELIRYDPTSWGAPFPWR